MGLDSDAPPRPVCLLQYASYCLLFISIYDTTVVLRRCCCSYDTLRYVTIPNACSYPNCSLARLSTHSCCKKRKLFTHTIHEVNLSASIFPTLAIPKLGQNAIIYSLKMATEKPNSYLEKVRLKRIRNQEQIESLGLNNLSPAPRSKKQRSTATLSPNPSSNPPRRSSRRSKKPIEFVALDYEANALEKKIERRKAHKVIKKRKFDLGQQMSPDKRAAFEAISSDEWLEDMKYYFSVVEDNSKSNVQRVMYTTKKLVSGHGVTHPQTQNTIWKNKKIHLGLDFRQMLDEASEWVYENGGDRGNGWLVEHPIKKLWVYQQARAQNKNQPFIKKQNAE